MSEKKIYPLAIRLLKKSRLLKLEFDDGSAFELSCEFLRVHSPSAEVRGHAPGQSVLQLGKEHVGIDKIEQIGNYALKLCFDDGHDSGLYSWGYLYELGKHQGRYWQQYLAALKQAGHARQVS